MKKEDTVRKTATADKAVAVSVYQEPTLEMTTAETLLIMAEAMSCQHIASQHKRNLSKEKE